MIGWTDAEIRAALLRVREVRDERELNVSRVRRFTKLLADERAFDDAAYHRELSRRNKVSAI